MRFSYSRRSLRWAGIARAPSSIWQRSRSRGRCRDAEGVTGAASYGLAPVKCGLLGVVQFGSAAEVGDLARHV